MAERVLDSARMFVGVREVRRPFALPEYVADALELALRENAPQALLRDLDRPVMKFEVGIADFDRVEIPRDAGRDAYAEVKQTFSMDRRVPIESLAQSNRWAKEAMREIYATLAKPWADAPKFGQVYLTPSQALVMKF